MIWGGLARPAKYDLGRTLAPTAEEWVIIAAHRAESPVSGETIEHDEAKLLCSIRNVIYARATNE